MEMDWEDDSPLSKITQHILETLKEIRRIQTILQNLPKSLKYF
jgi:ferritin-like metal-binding protein YciE